MPVLDVLRTETPRPRIVREYRHAGRLAVATVCLGSFICQLDTGIVAFSLPALQRDFGAPLAAAQWVSLSYLLAVAIVVVAAGRLAEAAGAKLIAFYGFMIVTVASAAWDGALPQCAHRIPRGAGGGCRDASGRGGHVLLLKQVPGQRLRAAIGVQGVAQALGLAAGPAIGGLLLASAGWRWVFVINLPVGCAGVLAARYLLPRTREHVSVGSFDYAGLLWRATFLLTLLLTITSVSGLMLPSGASAAIAVICVLSGSCLWLRNRRAHRLVEPSPPTRWPGNFAWAGVAGGYLALSAPLVLFSQVYAARAVHPAIAGLTVAALPAGFAVIILTGKLTRCSSGRARAVAAAVGVTTAGGLAMSLGSTLMSGVLLIALGMSLGVLITADSAAIGESIRHGGSPVGNALRIGSREVGMALAVATVTLCLHLSGRPVPDTAGARVTLAVLAIAVMIAAVALLPFISRRPPAQTAADTDATVPDARFLLANERTFLAWSRTALALVAAGLAIVQLLHPFPGVAWGRHLLGVSLIALGAVVSAIGYLELRRNQRALHRGEPLPSSALPKVLAIAITSIAIVSAVVLIISAVRGQ